MKKIYLSLLLGLLTTEVFSARLLNDGSPDVLKVGQMTLKKISSLVEIRFDRVPLQPNLKSSEMSFDLPPGTLSFAINIQPTNKLDFTYVDTLINPRGEEIISNAPEGVDPRIISDPRLKGRAQRVSLNAMQPEAFEYFSSTPVPNGPKVRVIPGRWKLIVSSEKIQTDLKVVILVKVLKGPFDAKTFGSVNLNVSSTLASGFQLKLPELQQKLFPALKFYERNGILLNIISSNPLPNEYDQTSDSPRKPEMYERLMKLMRGKVGQPQVPALDVYFLKRNNFANLGIATLNGAAGIFAAPKEKFSGTVVWTEPHLDATTTLAHELGHQFGLYHTDVDTFSDTAAMGHWLNPNSGQKPNLMHVGGEELVFSPQQQDMIRMNVGMALYREVTTPLR